MAQRPDLSTAKWPADELARMAQGDTDLLQEMLDGISPAAQKGARRENCSQGLMRLAEFSPSSLLPHWDYLVSLLGTGNGASQYTAVYILASLAEVGGEGRFGKVFDLYFALLEGESVMVAGHVALNAARVARALPGLGERIARRLIRSGPSQLTLERQELVKAYIIEALDSMMPQLDDRSAIMEYVAKTVGSGSPKTRKLANAFLKQWAGE